MAEDINGANLSHKKKDELQKKAKEILSTLERLMKKALNRLRSDPSLVSEKETQEHLTQLFDGEKSQSYGKSDQDCAISAIKEDCGASYGRFIEDRFIPGLLLQ